MADLNIPKLNMNSDKYIFKKKLTLRRKSQKRLFIEAAFMFILSLLLVYVNYLIPNKNLLAQNFLININESLILIINIFSNLFDVFLVVFIFISWIIIFFLLLGAIYRIFRVVNKSTRKKIIK